MWKDRPFPGRLNSGAIRPRHDGFTPAKQRKFFKALKKCGCIRDACQAADISKTTVDRRTEKAKLAEGYMPGPDGQLVVPPGWQIVPAAPLLPPPS